MRAKQKASWLSHPFAQNLGEWMGHRKVLLEAARDPEVERCSSFF
jgi:hypothetical protein